MGRHALSCPLISAHTILLLVDDLVSPPAAEVQLRLASDSGAEIPRASSRTTAVAHRRRARRVCTRTDRCAQEPPSHVNRRGAPEGSRTGKIVKREIVLPAQWHVTIRRRRTPPSSGADVRAPTRSPADRTARTGTNGLPDRPYRRRLDAGQLHHRLPRRIAAWRARRDDRSPGLVRGDLASRSRNPGRNGAHGHLPRRLRGVASVGPQSRRLAIGPRCNGRYGRGDLRGGGPSTAERLSGVLVPAVATAGIGPRATPARTPASPSDAPQGDYRLTRSPRGGAATPS